MVRSTMMMMMVLTKHRSCYVDDRLSSLQDSSGDSDSGSSSDDHRPVLSAAATKQGRQKLRDSVAQAKQAPKEAKESQKSLSKQLKELSAALNKEPEQFIKWRHTHRDDKLSRDMDSAMAQPNSKTKRADEHAGRAFHTGSVVEAEQRDCPPSRCQNEKRLHMRVTSHHPH